MEAFFTEVSHGEYVLQINVNDRFSVQRVTEPGFVLMHSIYCKTFLRFFVF